MAHAVVEAVIESLRSGSAVPVASHDVPALYR